jgi:hypothetical protein
MNIARFSARIWTILHNDIDMNDIIFVFGAQHLNAATARA